MYKSISIDYESVNPYLSVKTIDVHFNRHYMGYLNKLNDILSYLGYDFKYSKEELVDHIDMFELPYRDSILYNLGGVLNHELYFKTLGFGGSFGGALRDKLIKQYGSIDAFKNEFKRQANLLVGSGYTFLVMDKKGDLLIINMSNQDTPYSYGYLPIFNIDLWEHAYYLDYLNDRSLYIDDFFSMIDFNFVNKNYEKVSKEV